MTSTTSLTHRKPIPFAEQYAAAIGGIQADLIFSPIESPSDTIARIRDRLETLSEGNPQ